jgi:hypothetical protein
MSSIQFKGKPSVETFHLTVPYRRLVPLAEQSRTTKLSLAPLAKGNIDTVLKSPAEHALHQTGGDWGFRRRSPAPSGCLQPGYPPLPPAGELVVRQQKSGHN